jgi:predicted nicotinamide N-methyase
MVCQRYGSRETRCIVTDCIGVDCCELHLCFRCHGAENGLSGNERLETCDAVALDRMIAVHTVVGKAHLVPEVHLRLLRKDSPLWRCFGDDPALTELPRPYWAFAWSGGQALARFILDTPELAAGKQVLDFGAGCGIAGISAAKAGARKVTASDIDPVSVRAIIRNAELNGVRVEAIQADLLYADNPGWDVILAGDIWYDSRLARHALNWLKRLAKTGVTVLTGDPGRGFSPGLGMAPLATYPCRSVPDLEHPMMQTVSVFRVPAEQPEAHPEPDFPHWPPAFRSARKQGSARLHPARSLFLAKSRRPGRPAWRQTGK